MSALSTAVYSRPTVLRDHPAIRYVTSSKNTQWSHRVKSLSEEKIRRNTSLAWRKSEGILLGMTSPPRSPPWLLKTRSSVCAVNSSHYSCKGKPMHADPRLSYTGCCCCFGHLDVTGRDFMQLVATTQLEFLRLEWTWKVKITRIVKCFSHDVLI